MQKIIKSFYLILAIIVITSTAVYAGGLSTTFVEVKLKDVKPGKTYSIKEVKGKALIIKNTTEDMTVDIGIEPEKPVEYNLVPGYEAIPDLAWVTIETDHFKDIGPGEKAETDVFISIPKGKEHEGKKYQVYLYSHTEGQATFRTGLMSRLLIDMREKDDSPNKPKGKSKE